MSAAPAVAASHAEPSGFRHEAMLYAGEDGFLAGALPFLREGIERGEPAFVVVSAAKIALLREALGEDADCVRFADMAEVGTNPARIISAWKDFVEQAGADRPLRGIGEPVWPERTAAELVECHRHESLLNLAFADAPSFRLLCPYDTTALDPPVVQEALRTHPLVSVGEHACESTCFRGLHAAAAPWTAPLGAPPADAQVLAFEPRGLGALRAAVALRAQESGLSPKRTEDLVLAVNELATNSLLHGGGRGTLRLWDDGEAVVCEVQDAGRLQAPLAGRVRPREGQIGRYGLWLVNKLCDFVEQRSLPDGNLMRVHVRHDGGA